MGQSVDPSQYSSSFNMFFSGLVLSSIGLLLSPLIIGIPLLARGVVTMLYCGQAGESHYYSDNNKIKELTYEYEEFDDDDLYHEIKRLKRKRDMYLIFGLFTMAFLIGWFLVFKSFQLNKLAKNLQLLSTHRRLY